MREVKDNHMHISNSHIAWLSKEMKAVMQAVVYAEGLTQEEIAEACSVSSSTCNRWLKSAHDELHFPAFMTGALTDPRMHTLAYEILRYQADRLGYDVVVKLKPGKTYGPIDDEIAGLVQQMGALRAEVGHEDPREHILRRHIDAAKNIIRQAEEEVRLLTKR